MGNEDSWRNIMGDRPRTLALLAHWLGSSQRAEDVWQEAALRFGQAQERGQFIEHGPASALTYFMRLLRNCCIDELRGSKRRAQSFDPSSEPAAVQGRLDNLEERALCESVLRALDALPPEWASAIQMVCLESLPLAKAAERLKVKPALVSVWIYRGRRRLKEMLRAQLQEMQGMNRP